MKYQDFKHLEYSDETPDPTEYPATRWISKCLNGDKYIEAFKVETKEDADAYLLALVGHSLRYMRLRAADGRVVSITWRQAFKHEREELAWFALARDVKNGGLFRREQDFQGNWGTVENRAARDFAWSMYGAELPKSATGKPEKDIVERVHVKRAKAAESKGQSYWRKGHTPPASPAPAQGGLF
jgi:hypothetical protein